MKSKPVLFKTPKQGEDLLLEACRCDHHNKVRVLLNVGVDPNVKVSQKLRADIQKKKQQHTEAKHTTSSKIEQLGDTPLTVAAKNGSVNALEVLLSFEETRFDQTDTAGRNLLHWVCKRGYTNTLERILNCFKEYPPYRMVPIPGAQKHRKTFPKVIDILCEKDKLGRNCLMLASWSGHTEIVNMLLEIIMVKPETMSTMINEQELDKGWTALFGACKYGHTEVVARLIEFGAHVDMSNGMRCTPLIVATRGNHIDVVSLLLNAGANAQLADCNDRTALHDASESCLPEILEKLIAHLKKTKGATNLLRTISALDRLYGRSVSDLAKMNQETKISKRATLHSLADANFMIYSDIDAFP